MFCGVGAFSYIEDDHPRSQAASPRGRCSSKKSDKNPYSARGLDKFSAVLAELEAKRQSIIKQAGSQGAPTIRFMYSDSNWIPIIVKKVPHEEDSKKINKKTIKSELRAKSLPKEVVVEKVLVRRNSGEKQCKGGAKPCGDGKIGMDGLMRRPLPSTWYCLVMVVMILVCLAMSGRSFAICCTSIWWYAIPAVRKRSGNTSETIPSQKSKD